MVGDPTGATAKYWLSGSEALDFGLGVSENLTLLADYSLHSWGLLPQPKKGDLGAYASLGGRWENLEPADFGIRALGGLSYWPKLKGTYEFFLELGPVFRLTPSPARVRLDGGFGVRWYFSKK